MTSHQYTVSTREDVFYQAVNCYFGVFVYLAGYNRFLVDNPKFSIACAILSGLFLLLGLILTAASFYRTPPNYANFILKYIGPGIDIVASASIIIGFLLAIQYLPSKPFLFHLFLNGTGVLLMMLVIRKMVINLQQVSWYKANVIRALKILPLLVSLIVLILMPIGQLSITGAAWALAAGLVLLAIAMIIEVCKVEQNKKNC